MFASFVTDELFEMDVMFGELVDLSKAKGTWKAYDSAWNRFASFCVQYCQPLLPSTPLAVGRYLTHLVRQGKGPSSAKMAMAAIKAFHVREALPSPTDNQLVRLGLSGMNRSLGSIPKQAFPMTKEILRRLMKVNLGGALHRHPSGKGPSLQAWRNTWFEVTAFLTVSRFSDLQLVRKGDVIVTAKDVTILFRSRKNDKTHTGHRSVMLATGDRYCPVRLTRRYLARLPPGPDTTLLPALRGKGGGGTLPPYIKYDAMRRYQGKLLTKAGFDPAKFGLHSGRVGGSCALKRAGWSWPEIAAYGGWAPGSREPEKYTKTVLNESRRMARSIPLFRG
jgi:hypothetical protein